MFTRPNLVYSINYLARFIFNLSIEHLKYLDNIFSCLVKIRNLGLDLTLQFTIKFSNMRLLEISNIDQRGNLEYREFTSSNLFTL